MGFSNTDFLIIYLTVIILMIVLMAILVYVFFIKKKSQLILSKIEQKTRYEREISDTTREVQEQTLTNIGRELHDDLGQKLSVAKLLNSQLLTHCTDCNKELLQEINGLLGECIQDIRNLSRTFISEQVESFGLTESLMLEVNRINKLEQVSIDFRCNREHIDLNAKHALIIFRIIQELLNNALKHSRAKRIELVLEDRANVLEITVEDNGNGYSPDDAEEGSGLRNIRNRLQLLNADIEINSAINRGTQNRIIFNKTISHAEN